MGPTACKTTHKPPSLCGGLVLQSRPHEAISLGQVILVSA